MKIKIDDLPRINIKKDNKLKLTLQVPLSINHMYYNTRDGGKRLTKKAEDYIRVNRAIIHLAMQEQGWKIQEKGVWIYVDMIFYMPDKRIRDASNCLKLLLDVMENVIYKNDMFAIPRIQSVELDRDNPRLEVIISAQSEKERQKSLNLFMI